MVVAYDASIVPSSCRPPLYTGCIVARRQFSFSEYQQLHLPITIDPECKDVPCDAFSTCRTGKCFKSEVTCADGRCLEPGDDGSGGTSDAGVVIPDAGGDGAMPPVDAGSDSSADATTDGPDDGGALGDGGIDLEAGPGGAVGCNGTGLMCPAPTACGGTAQSCCGTGGDAPVCSPVGSCQAGSTRYCCRDADCTAGKFCIFVVSGPLPPGPNVPPAPLPPPAPLIPAGTCN